MGAPETLGSPSIVAVTGRQAGSTAAGRHPPQVGGFPPCCPLPPLWLTVCVCVCASFQHTSESNLKVHVYFAAIQLLSPTLCDPMNCSPPGVPVLHYLEAKRLLKLMSIPSVMPSNHLILCHPLLLPPSVLPSIRVFSSESVLPIRWPKDWSFTFSISPSNEYSGLISFRMDWLDLLAVQETLKSLLQHYSTNSKAPILQCSAFFIVQLSHPYMTIGKTIALTRGILLTK